MRCAVRRRPRDEPPTSRAVADDQPLFTDVVRVGPQEARQHPAGHQRNARRRGIRRLGHPDRGSAQRAQRNLCRPTPRLILIHALNPYGFAWYRRVDAQQHRCQSQSHRSRRCRAGQSRLRVAAWPAVPEDWSDATRLAGARTLAIFRRGMAALLSRMRSPAGSAAIMTGSSLAGAGRAGRSSCCARRWRLLVMHTDRVILLDMHTGLGSYGGCQLICGIEEGSPRVAARAPLARRRCTVLRARLRASSVWRARSTPAASAARRNCRVTPVTVEFGTLADARGAAGIASGQLAASAQCAPGSERPHQAGYASGLRPAGRGLARARAAARSAGDRARDRGVAA